MIARQIIILDTAFVVMLIAAFTVPRMFAGDDFGFAAAARVAVIFLILVGVAHVIAIYGFIVSLSKKKTLSLTIFLAGLLPFPLAVILDAAFCFYLLARA